MAIIRLHGSAWQHRQAALRANREQPRRVTSFYIREGPNLSSLETSPLNARAWACPDGTALGRGAPPSPQRAGLGPLGVTILTQAGGLLPFRRSGEIGRRLARPMTRSNRPLRQSCRLPLSTGRAAAPRGAGPHGESERRAAVPRRVEAAERLAAPAAEFLPMSDHRCHPTGRRLYPPDCRNPDCH